MMTETIHGRFGFTVMNFTQAFRVKIQIPDCYSKFKFVILNIWPISDVSDVDFIY